MKLKKLLSKVLVLSIITTATMMSFVTFADTTEGNPFIEKEKLSPQDKIIELATEYTPENLDTWVNLFSEKEIIKADIEALKTEITPVKEAYIALMKEEFKAEKEAFIADLWDQVNNGQITQEEAAEIFQAEKSARQEAADIRKEEKEERIAEILAEREAEAAERQALKELLKLSVEDGNDNEIISTLNTMLSKAIEAQTTGYERINTLTERLAELEAAL